MKRSLYLLIPLTGILLAVPNPAARAITLVENGTPRATIVVASSALNPAKDDAAGQKINVAAHDLQDYLQKMSGVVLPLVADDANPTGPLILVGRSQRTDAMKLDIPSGLTPERREEGFLIQSGGDRLVLAGNDAGPYHGTEYATYELLNRLGVRWYMPGDFGEIVPLHKTIVVDDMTDHEKPDFIQRDWGATMTPEMGAMEKRWKIRNKMDPDPMFATPNDQSIIKFMVPPTQAKEHPELFAKNYDGSVNLLLPNLSNPETVKIAAEKAEDYFRAHPEASSIGMAPADGRPRDFTAKTMELNQGFPDLGGRLGLPEEMSNTEEWLEWVNAVTRTVNQDFPGYIITTNGYSNRNMAPFGVKIDPHISIMFAAIWSDTLHALDDPKSWQMNRQAALLRQWTQLDDKVWLYGYDEIMLVSALTPVPGTRKLARDFPLLKKWGVVGFNNESRNVWAERGIATRYLEARLMWSTNLDVKSLLDGFYQDWYGAAARPEQAFWDALEETMEKTPVLGHEDRILPFIYNNDLLVRLENQIGAAEHLAATPVEKEHVRADRLILEHLKEYVALSHADLTGNYAEAIRQGKDMLKERVELSKINSFFIRPSELNAEGLKDLNSGVYYWSLADRLKYYQKMLDQTSGVTGNMVAFLPERAAFALDPKTAGRYDGWWQSDWDTKNWNEVTPSRPFYLQGPPNHPYYDQTGYPYLGDIWYQFRVKVPHVSPGSSVRLYVPVVECEAWVWINGQYAGHRPYVDAYERPNEMDVDVTDMLKPGAENVVTFLVSTSLNQTQEASGLLGRPFLYSPLQNKNVPSNPVASGSGN